MRVLIITWFVVKAGNFIKVVDLVRLKGRRKLDNRFDLNTKLLNYHTTGQQLSYLR